MKYRLPILIERTVRDAYTARTELATHVEQELQTLDAPLTCVKGCHNCCYHPVSLSLFEAITIFRWLSQEMLWTRKLKDKFKDAADKTLGLSLDVWMLSLIPCPLLTDGGLCQAYEERPFICRATVSVGDEHLCHPHRISEGTAMIPRLGFITRLHEAEEPLRRRYEIGKLKMPLASAILIAELICKGELEIEDVGAHIWLDLRVNG